MGATKCMNHYIPTKVALVREYETKESKIGLDILVVRFILNSKAKAYR